MSKLKIALLLVFSSGQICGSQIFGGGGLNRPQGMPRGGILNPDGAARMGGGILGGHGIGPGGREGILGGHHHHQQQRPPPHPQGGHLPPRGQDGPGGQRVRMGPIVFDPQHLEYDDNDDYAHGDEERDRNLRPHLGLDLSNLFIPLVNFMKFTGKSLESLFTLLENQANLLLGRKPTRDGSLSVSIVIIISWLVMGMVVYALAQYSTLRRIRQEEEEAEAIVRNQLLANIPPPIFQTTPPTPQPQNGTNVAILSSGAANPNNSTAVKPATTPNSTPKSIWLPSVGALQLSDSSILKRRESAKRKRKAKENSCNRSRIRHRSSNVDHATVSWIEMGLDRVQTEDDIKASALKKWQGFLRQHVMQNLEQDGFQIEYQELLHSELPQLSNIDVEMCDEQNLIVTMDIVASFEAQMTIQYIDENVERPLKLRVPKVATRLECKIPPQEGLDETPLHVRQTGHVTVDVELMTPTHCESCCLVQQMIGVAITDALKNVDCDLPPIGELCGPQSQDSSDEGVFIETPSSYSFPSPPKNISKEKSLDCSEDQLFVTLLKASLAASITSSSSNSQHANGASSSNLQLRNKNKTDQFRPYVILEMDHPAQKYNTKMATDRRKGLNGSLDFRWSSETRFQFTVSTEKTFELLVELWNDETNQEQPFDIKFGEVPLSPAAIGHRFLGLCLVSVQDLISCPFQTHVVSLQGRPFSEDEGTNGTLSLQFEYVPDKLSEVCGSTFPQQQTTLMPTTFNGVHKTLEMKQCQDNFGQPVFITNATYTADLPRGNKGNAIERKSCSLDNSVALAAVRDLQTQRNLRMGTPPATKSTLLIRSVHKSSEAMMATNSSNDEPACDRNLPTGNGSPKNMQIQTKNVQNSPRRIIGSAPQTPRKEKRPKRKGFLALLRKRLKSKRSRTTRETISMPSHELSSSIVEEDEEPNSANVSDSISSCSGRSSCCSEQSYHLYSWKGPLSASWESLKSISVQNLNVPLQTQEDADSLSDASGFSIPSTTNSPLRGDFSNRGGIKSFTALILETIEENETMYYLIPKHLAKKGKLKKRGTKLHICQDHMFLAKHIKSGGSCSVCQKKITARLGKKMYTCRDCGMICHKECFDKTQDICTQSTLQSLELKHIIQEKRPIMFPIRIFASS